MVIENSDATTAARSRPEGGPGPGRIAVALTLVGLTVASLTIWSMPYRSLEARAARSIVGLFGPTRLYRDEWRVTHGRAGMWFVVTFVCTSSVMVVPLISVATATILMPRVRLRAALGGVLAGTVTVVAANTARLALVGVSWHAWGASSLWIAHDLIGTVVSLLAMAIGVGAQLAVVGRHDPSTGRHFERPAVLS